MTRNPNLGYINEESKITKNATITRNPNLGYINEENKSESFTKNLRNDKSLSGKRDLNWFSITDKD